MATGCRLTYQQGGMLPVRGSEQSITPSSAGREVNVKSGETNGVVFGRVSTLV
jgi:hypothetical protein